MDKTELNHKKIWEQSENAVNIDIWVAICTYLIVARVKREINSNLSIYQIVQILEISVFDKTLLNEILTEYQANQNDKEQLDLFNN